ncbi:GerMN domain-containing protein [Propionibacteriaceae bacterium G1746]
MNAWQVQPPDAPVPGLRAARRRWRWLLLAAGVALVVGLLLPVLWPRSALFGRTQPPATPGTALTIGSSAPPASLPTLQRSVPVYYVGDDRRLYREFRDLPTQGDRLTTAVGAVLNVAANDPGFSSLWAGGQVNSATIVGNRLVIDISASAFATFTSRVVADAAINQVVYTAVAAVGDTTGERTVQILMDGSPNLPVVGLPTADFKRTGTDPLGLIWIEVPEGDSQLPAGRLTLRGYQQVSLTNDIVSWMVADHAGSTVQQGEVPASGNIEGWRSWAVNVTLAAGDYELKVWTGAMTPRVRHFTVA